MASEVVVFVGTDLHLNFTPKCSPGLLQSVLSAALLATFPFVAVAGEPTTLNTKSPLEDPVIGWSENLGGDWLGLRPMLNDKGVTFDLTYTSFGQGLFQGDGNQDFEFADRYDALVNLNLERLAHWEGASVHAHLEYNNSIQPLSRGGALLPVNTATVLPVGEPESFIASSLYLKQQFSPTTSMMVGKINVIDLLARDPFFGGWGNERFMNVAFVGPISGLLPPTIMGFIFNHQLDSITWTATVYDPNDQTSNYSVSDLFSDGVNLSLTATWSGEWAGRASSVAINGIYSTKDSSDLADFLLPPDLQTGTLNDSWHASVKVAHLLRESSVRPGAGLGLYAKAGFSDGNPNPFEGTFAGGLAAHGMIPGRESDVFGVGYFYYNFSGALQSAVAPVANFDNEEGVEVFYKFAVTPWFDLSADLQWIDPANGKAGEAWIGALRAGIEF